MFCINLEKSCKLFKTTQPITNHQKGKNMRNKEIENNSLSHVDKNGKINMVDVSPKDVTERIAVASGKISMSKEAFNLVKNNNLNKKGDVISTAKVAGIMAAKKTSELIPLCHPLLIDKVQIDLVLNEKNLSIEVSGYVKCSGKTGIEMEALTGVSIALLTIYDMVKAVDKSMIISDVKLIEKKGGKSGHFIA